MSSDPTAELVELLREGQFDQVAELGAQMTRSQPNVAVPWALLAAAQAGLGKLEDAEAHYQTALALNPDFVDARFNLGVLYAQQNDWAAAKACFARVVQTVPDHALARMRLANAWHATNQLSEAADAYAEAVRLNPSHAETRANYGSALMGLNRLTEALTQYDEAIKLAPSVLGYRVDRAQARINVGAFEEAKADLSHVLGLKPNHAKAHFRLSTVKTFTPDDPDIAVLGAALATGSLSLSDKVFLHAALAKALDDTGQVEEAFTHFQAGNVAHKRLLNYTLAKDRAEFQTLKAEQTAKRLPPLQPAAAATPKPVFVLGLPRSGTSLVEQILASHADVTGGGELSYFEDALIKAKTPDEVRTQYLDRLARLDPGAPVITDKRPMNFKWIGYILQALPEATILNIRRDPVAAGWSMFRHHFESPAVGFTNDLEDIAGMIGLYEDLMAHFEAEFPGRVHTVSYEKLTENQEGESRKIIAACGLDWDHACLEFHRADRAVQTASAAQVRQKMYRGSSAAWRKYDSYLQNFRKLLRA